MPKLDSPEIDFEPVALIVGSVFLLRPEDARDFVRECEKRGLHIAGLEAFRVYEGPKIQPIQELSTDLDISVDSWEQTIEDLRGPFADNIWFEVVPDRIGRS